MPRSPRLFADDPLRPVIWTVSVTRLSRLLSDVVPQFDARAQIEPINLGFEEAARHVAQRLRTEHCDVIVAAGSNGAYLKGRVPLPVVLVKASGFDLMQALARARQVSDRIGVVTHQNDLPEFAEFQRGFGLKIAQRSFVTAEDARHCVAELVAKGVKVVVGTGLATELAEQAGITGVLLYSAESVRTAFESALDIARASRPGGFSARSRRPARLPGIDALLGDSAQMSAVRDQVRRYAASDTTVLITGATGTGKELVARALHGLSARARGPFIAVNCGALAESLLESELFGHEEGAFTGSRRGGRTGLIESADGGTLFLDEIGEMPLALQTRLLRVLEEREVLRLGSSRPVPVDLRIIAATHGNLGELAAQGRFRRDLYYRLDILRIALPSLAERPSDIPLLAEHFLRHAATRAALSLAPDALALLARHSWPGNVRELRNLMERMAAHFATGSTPAALGRVDLLARAPELSAKLHASVPVAARPARRPGAVELEAALLRAGGSRARAAAMLGVSRTTFWRWQALAARGRRR